jgi:hypothetical protein
MARTLYALQMIFTVWMLVDAVRRKPERYWYVVLFFPFGPLVYFFAVKIDDYDLGFLKALVRPGKVPSIDALREAYRASPSFANRVRLASGLHDTGAFAEAAEEFAAALDDRPDDPDALYGLGLCKLELADYEDAVGPLSRLVDARPAFHDHGASAALARALAAVGRDDEATEVLEATARRAPRLSHALALAQQLAHTGKTERARDIVRGALREHESAPVAVRMRERVAAREARALSSTLG